LDEGKSGKTFLFQVQMWGNETFFPVLYTQTLIPLPLRSLKVLIRKLCWIINSAKSSQCNFPFKSCNKEIYGTHIHTELTKLSVNPIAHY